jgi:hypothetical protein
VTKSDNSLRNLSFFMYPTIKVFHLEILHVYSIYYWLPLELYFNFLKLIIKNLNFSK